MRHWIKTCGFCLLLTSAIYGSVLKDARNEEPIRVIGKIGKMENRYGNKFWCLEATDGVRWRIDEQKSNMDFTTSWEQGDSIIIYPLMNRRLFSAQFALKNPRTHSFIFADILEGPTREKSKTLWISKIDRTNSKIYIERGDGAADAFQVYQNDNSKLWQWKQDDLIVLGSNKTPDAQQDCSFSRICINVRTKEYIRVELVKY